MNKNLQHEQMKQEAINDIIECLEDSYNGYYCDLHNEVFNMDYYVIYYSDARKILTEYDVFDAIELVTKYEKELFNEIFTEISDPVKLLNMVYYVIGDEIIQNILAEVEEFNNEWNEQANEETNEIIIKYLKEQLQED